MRSLPNMSIIETGDATDVENVLEISKNINGPVYIRMIRGEIPRLFPKENPTVFGQSRKLSEGNDIALLTSGICTEESLNVTNQLREKGITIQHLHITTLKPFGDSLIEDALTKVKYGIITMENHTTVGGLGTCVAELIAKKLKMKFLSSGALYRFCALKTLENKNTYNVKFINKIANSITLKKLQNKKLYSPEVARLSSIIAKKPYVRKALKVFQKNFIM